MSVESGVNKLVLIVEPDTTVVDSIQGCLVKADYEVVSTANGGAGLKKARENLPDVILVNLKLEDKNGIEWLKELKKDPAIGNIPVLILCKEDELITARIQAFSNGALGCVACPINNAELLAQVEVMSRLTRTHAALQENVVTLSVTNYELEETKKQLEEKKKELEKSSSYKSEFLAKMSHELRTPLTAMMGFAQKALHTAPTEKDYRSSIKTILRNGEHLLELINDILDLSKIEAGKLEVELIAVSPLELLHDIRALMSIRAEQKGLDFWIEYQSPLPESIVTDAMRVKQILLNLVGNSIKFTQKGSVKIGVSCDRDKEQLLFQVTDTGIGIPEDKKNKLFQAFVQGDTEVTRKFGGTGLGLTISLQLAELLGGSISVDSILGMGSSFKVVIKTGPLADVKFLNPTQLENIKYEEEESAEIRIETLKGKILIAEDNPDNLKLLEYYISKSGVEYIAVGNGQEVLDCALDEGFDLILLDMQMPIMDGYTAAKKLRDRGFVKPIIALTANSLESEIKKSLEAGCDKVLSKPYNWNLLFGLLKEYIGDGTNSDVISLKAVNSSSEIVDVKSSEGQEQVKDYPVVSEMYFDNSDFQPLIQEFIEGLGKYLASIEAHLKSKEWLELKGVAHDLSGVSGMYGYPECSAIAKELQHRCLAKDESGINEHSDKLLKYLKRMEAGLSVMKRGFVPSSNQPDPCETEVITSELFKLSPDLIPHIIEFLDNIDDVLSRLSKISAEKKWRELIQITNEVSGTASLFGYPEFAMVVKKLEQSVEEGKVDKIPQMLDQLNNLKAAMLRGKEQAGQ